MPSFPGDLPAPDIPPIRVPAVPEVVTVPADLPTIRPDVVVTLPASESVSDAVVVPAEHGGADVLYLAVSQQRVNVWAAAVYFAPEIALGVCGLVVLVALRKLWVRRRFGHRKGEPYCKKCLAGLTGVESDACPECGRPVAKTRRVAKRSRRSPLSPAWCWALAAVVLSLGTATLWFGESWHRLSDHGIDPKDNADWWALIDPVDRESPIRINKAATWLDWRSARLAAYARERDHAWIEMLDWEYKEGEGVTHRLLVRRYDTTDGALLSEDMLPADSFWQDDSSWESTSISLYYMAGAVLIDDYDALFRYRYAKADPWVKIGESWDPDPQIEYTASAVSVDGSFVITESRKRVGDGLFDLTYGSTTLTVYDLDTGKTVAVLQVTVSDDLADYLKPTLTPNADSDPPTDTIRFAYNSFIPIDAPGKLALVSEDTSVTWDYLNHTLALDGPTLIRPDLLRNDLIFYKLWSGLFGGPVDIPELDDAGIQRELRELRESGIERVTLDTIANNSKRVSGYIYPPPPWDQYDPQLDVLIYELANLQSVSLPSRVLSIDAPYSGEMSDTWLSPNGRWLDVAFRSRQTHGPDNRSWLRVDMDSAQPVGWFSEWVRGAWMEGRYVNGGAQFVVVCEVQRAANPAFSRYDRDEIHIYNMPDE